MKKWIKRIVLILIILLVLIALSILGLNPGIMIVSLS